MIIEIFFTVETVEKKSPNIGMIIELLEGPPIETEGSPQLKPRGGTPPPSVTEGSPQL
jgi:hypothetical protein